MGQKVARGTAGTIAVTASPRVLRALRARVRLEINGYLVIPTGAVIFIADGFHRISVIFEVNFAHAALANQLTQSVALYVAPPGEFKTVARQKFVDINANQKAIDLGHKLAHDIADPHNVLSKRIEVFAKSIGAGGISRKKSVALDSADFTTSGVAYKAWPTR